MSYDQKDLSIFVTGVVGRAMGSGKFGHMDIPDLTKAALDAFQEHLAPKLAQSAPAHSPPPGASGGPQKPDWHAGAAAVAGGGNGVQPETKSFSIWGGDKSYVFGRNDAIWADLLGEAQEGNAGTLELLKKTANGPLGEDPKWHKNNARRIGRAKACLAMLAQKQG
jgi:hypothetical protein